MINIPTAINSIAVGTNRPSTLAQFRANPDTIQNPTLRRVANVARTNSCEYVVPGSGRPAGADACPFATQMGRMVFTDDLAPGKRPMTFVRRRSPETARRHRVRCWRLGHES